MDPTGVLSAFGLSAGAGLNAYIPLFVLGLLNRYTGLVSLREPWANLSSGWVLAVLAALILVEALADNIPGVNHVNDIIQTFIRPAAGALAFVATSKATGTVDPVLAVIAGILVAGTVHTAKATVVRPAVNVTTAGMGNTPVSVAEDVTAAGVSVLALALPVVVGVASIAGVVVVAGWLFRRRRRRRRL